jgi:anti-sigma regulatory factor (Ser/Thr protein kinase)
MEVTRSRRFEVGESSQAGEVRREAMTLAREVGFDDIEAGKVGIVVTEASSNLVKHGKGGQMLVQALGSGDRQGIGAIALDQGPGLSNLADMMRDGFSTSGTAGTGLGAIVRQSNQFDVYSTPGKGTAVFAGIWPRGRVELSNDVTIGGVCVPVRGESECGDAWAMARRSGTTYLMVADGLGHGSLAHEASARAAEVFRAHAGSPFEEMMSRLHDALRSTRGAAVALAEVIPARAILRFGGVGNIAGRVFANGHDRHLVSHFGTLGHDVLRIQQFDYVWTPESTLVLNSDGLGNHWTLDDYPGLSRHDPTLVAGVLYRDHARNRDDCTVVVARQAA